MLVLALAGCAAEVYTQAFELRIVADDLKVLGALNVPSPLLADTVTCPTIHCDGFDCPSDAEALACYHQQVEGDAVLDGGCLRLGGPGDVLWKFVAQDCAANEDGYEPVSDSVAFRVVGTGRVHAEATDVEDLVELFLDPGPDPWPTDWRTPADQPLRVVEGAPFRLFPLLVEDLTGFEVGWTLDHGRASATGGIEARWDPERLAIELELEPGQDGEVRFRVDGSPEWPIREVVAAPADAPASLAVVVAYYRDLLTYRLTPVGARAVVRDRDGRLLWGTPVEWTLDDGELAVGDPWVTLPGGDYVTLLDECVPPEQREGPHRATLRATWGDLTATADLAWNVPPLLPEPGWERNPYCVVGEPPADDPDDPTTPGDPTADPTPPAELAPHEFIAGAGGCGCSSGTPSPALAALLALGALRRTRRCAG